MNLWKGQLAVCLLFLVSIALVLAQDKPTLSGAPISDSHGTISIADKPDLKLTDTEKLAVTRAQLKMQQAWAAVQASPQWVAYQSASNGLNQTVGAVYSAHKVTDKEYALCDRPAAAGCETAPDNDITLQPLPKKDEKK